jgi:hypothetical protein
MQVITLWTNTLNAEMQTKEQMIDNNNNNNNNNNIEG